MKLNTLLFNSHLLAATTPQLLKMNLPTVIPEIVSSNTEIQTLLNKQLLLLKFVSEKWLEILKLSKKKKKNHRKTISNTH